MPIYEYVCASCGLEFEAIQKFSDEPLTECTCGQSGRVERKLSLSAFQLKGGGWYKDLYGGKSNAAAAGGKSGDSKGGGTAESKGEGKPAESKADGASSGGGASSAGESAKAASPATPSA
jgi:putative FmdB family regulatory protein